MPRTFFTVLPSIHVMVRIFIELVFDGTDVTIGVIVARAVGVGEGLSAADGVGFGVGVGAGIATTGAV